LYIVITVNADTNNRRRTDDIDNLCKIFFLGICGRRTHGYTCVSYCCFMSLFYVAYWLHYWSSLLSC